MTSRAATRLLSKMLGPDRCTKLSSAPCRPGTTPRSCGGLRDPNAGVAWIQAAQACAEGDLAWDEAYAQWRAAEAMLSDRSERATAVTALRRAHELAVDLEAAPLRAQVEALADTARVPLTIPQRSQDETATSMPGLTPREREVLAYVVAGRTYGEIARELVISEKTVSAHISNLLHKTGTSSRVELAQLVGRLARHHDQQGSSL
jgi:DNA-binding CsgD family transcriptional regulator